MLMQTNNLRQKHSSVIQENEPVQAIINDSNWNIPIANQIEFSFPWQINIVFFLFKKVCLSKSFWLCDRCKCQCHLPDFHTSPLLESWWIRHLYLRFDTSSVWCCRGTSLAATSTWDATHRTLQLVLKDTNMPPQTPQADVSQIPDPIEAT